MQVVIFDTYGEADTQQALDLVEHFKTHNDPKYMLQTAKWATPRERLDGRWDYTVCPAQNYSDFIVQDYNSEDYAQEEDEDD